MEISDQVENESIIKFFRMIHSCEIKDLIEYLAKDLFADVDYWIGEVVSLTQEDKKIKEYKGILKKFHGHIYQNQTFNYFECKIHPVIYFAESLNFVPHHKELSDKNTKDLWDNVRKSVNNYFLKYPEKRKYDNRVL